jgi:hypothetical protein
MSPSGHERQRRRPSIGLLQLDEQTFDSCREFTRRATSGLSHPVVRCVAQRSVIPITAIEGTQIGDAKSAADRVCCQGYRVRSDVDLLRDLDSIVDFDAEVPHGAFDFRVPKQQLDCAQVAGTPATQSCTSLAYCRVVSPPQLP